MVGNIMRLHIFAISALALLFIILTFLIPNLDTLFELGYITKVLLIIPIIGPPIVWLWQFFTKYTTWVPYFVFSLVISWYVALDIFDWSIEEVIQRPWNTRRLIVKIFGYIQRSLRLR